MRKGGNSKWERKRRKGDEGGEKGGEDESCKRARSERRGWNCPSIHPTCTHREMGGSVQLPDSQPYKILTIICNYNQRIKFQPVRRKWEAGG